MRPIKFSLFLFVPEALFIFLFAFYVDYDERSGPLNGTADSKEFDTTYPMFQDVHVMIFIGFGFLMTFLRRYGFGSVGFNLMLAAFVTQWAILIRGFFDADGFADGKINLSLDSLLNADFACGAVLISFGAVLGVLSPIQLVVMAFLEVLFYAINEFIIIELFQINDIGGSLVIHAFGAYFGLAVSILHWRKGLKKNPKEGSVYQSDIFAMIGTLFLWIYWPSFNASPAAGTMMGQRAVITTLYSLSAAAITSFVMSSALEKSGKLSMVHIQNATLAGGVAVGSVANLRLGPFGATAVGSFAGILSVVGYMYITPALQRLIKLHDTCGVHNLHGMPGILSAVVAVILARYSTVNTYSHHELHSIYPGSQAADFEFYRQSQFQLAGLAVTLGMAIAGGLITGFILKIPFLDPTTTGSLFDDDTYWKLDKNAQPETTDNGSATPTSVSEDKRRSSAEVKVPTDQEETSSSSSSSDAQSTHEQTPLTAAEEM